MTHLNKYRDTLNQAISEAVESAKDCYQQVEDMKKFEPGDEQAGAVLMASVFTGYDYADKALRAFMSLKNDALGVRQLNAAQIRGCRFQIHEALNALIVFEMIFAMAEDNAEANKN
jgi:hypothetical protein